MELNLDAIVTDIDALRHRIETVAAMGSSSSATLATLSDTIGFMEIKLLKLNEKGHQAPGLSERLHTIKELLLTIPASVAAPGPSSENSDVKKKSNLGR